MQPEIKIDPEAVQAQLVQAIINSAIGTQLETGINKALTEKTGGFYGKTLTERAVEEALSKVIREEAEKLAYAKREEIRAQLVEKMTDDMLSTMVGALWGVMSGRLSEAQ